MWTALLLTKLQVFKLLGNVSYQLETSSKAWNKQSSLHDCNALKQIFLNNNFIISIKMIRNRLFIVFSSMLFYFVRLSKTQLLCYIWYKNLK